MKPAAHAILSASGASKWLNCPPSARLEAEQPAVSSVFADEGTLAHDLGALLINRKLKRINQRPFEKELERIKTHDLYSSEMGDYCEDYANFVMEKYAEAVAVNKDAEIIVEKKVDLSKWIPEGFGTVDVQIICDFTTRIIDLKYGKGVPVEATENKQLQLYALGCLNDHDMYFKMDQVELTIYQPRLEIISTWQVSAEFLLDGFARYVADIAPIAFEGEGVFKAGAHCQFCKVKHTCRAHAEMQLQIARHDFAAPALLNDDEVVEILNGAKAFKSWLKSIEDYALDQAVNHQRVWPEMKIVEGVARRKYSDEAAVIETLQGKGFDYDQIVTVKPLGITEMTKIIGKNDFNAYLDSLIVKPRGKPVLVPVSDKRNEYNGLDQALKDFELDHDDSDDV